MWWCDGPIFWVWKILKALTLVLYQAVIFTFQTNDSEQILLNFNSFTSIYIAIMLNINNLFFFDCYTQPAHPILVCFWTFPPDIVFFFQTTIPGPRRGGEFEVPRSVPSPLDLVWIDIPTKRRSVVDNANRRRLVVQTDVLGKLGSSGTKGVIYFTYLYYLWGILGWHVAIDPNLLPTLPAKPSK